MTPLKTPDTLDLEGLERLIEHVLAGGVHGLFILGTTGEAPHLSYRLRREVIAETLRLVRRRIPVLVGITDTSFTEAVALGHFAAEHGATALVTSAPFYFPIAQRELANLIRHFARALPLPFYLYNMPQMTKVRFEPDTLRRAVQWGRVVGVKDSSGDLQYWRGVVEVARERPDWRLFVGPEELLVETMRSGGHGGVNGGAQVSPELLVGLYHAVRKKDEAASKTLQLQLASLGRIYSVGGYGASFVQGTKCALSLMGICSDTMTLPFPVLSSPQREQVRRVLDELGLLSGKRRVSLDNRHSPQGTGAKQRPVRRRVPSAQP